VVMMLSNSKENQTIYEINESSFMEVPSRWARKVNEIGLSNRFILISKYPELWVYIGEHGDHLILSSNGSPLYCSCKGFRMQIEKRTYKGCSHIYALKIAIKFSRYRDLSNKISLSDLNKIIEEIMEVDYSSHLREILVKQDVS